MGIEGLLPLLKPIHREVHIRDYKGKSVAIDGHCILHRGAYGAATALAEGIDTDTYVNHFMHYIGLLKHNGVTPVVVFDGLPLPIKKITNDQRAKQRKEQLALGHKLKIEGNHTAADKCFQQAITITSEMIRKVILRLMKEKVQCIVAPYEADAQLAHLMKTNKVEAVITEDSDLIAFGCSKLIYKIDRFGQGIEIKHQDIFTDFSVSLRLFNPELLRRACIASGCDYLPSLRGVGLKTAILAFKRYSDTYNALQCLKRNVHSRWIPDDYDSKFQQADLAFLHQWVYDMDETDYVRLNPLSKEINQCDISFLGKKPTVKDLTLLRVNKIIPKKKNLAKSVDGSSSTANAVASTSKPLAAPISPPQCIVSNITNHIIAYVDSVKENIEPHNYHARYHSTIKVPLLASKDNCKPKQKTTANTPDNKVAINKKRHCDVLSDTQPPPTDNNERRKRRIITLY